MMNRIGRERGWPPAGREQYEALRSPRGALAVGSPEQVAEKILFEHELFGHDRYIAQMSVGAVAHADVMRSIELFGTEVAPRRSRGGGTEDRNRPRAGGSIAHVTAERHRTPAFLFDLDGTLIDSVYQHVIAWREALEEVGINLAVWKIHRRIGMSGGLFVAALARELDTDLDRETLARLPEPARRCLRREVRQRAVAARSGAAAGDADRERGPLGDRHERRRALRAAGARPARAARRTRR